MSTTHPLARLPVKAPQITIDAIDWLVAHRRCKSRGQFVRSAIDQALLTPELPKSPAEKPAPPTAPARRSPEHEESEATSRKLAGAAGRSKHARGRRRGARRRRSRA